MSAKLIVPIILVAVLAAVSLPSANPPEKAHKLTTISPQKMADALHSVIAADRQVYAERVVQQLAFDRKQIQSVVDWQQAHALPVHAQLLRMAGQSIQKRGAEFSYTLRSLWPIHGGNGPQTEIEQTGLEKVARQPDQNFYAEEELGGRSYFTAIYADRATLPSCVQCHNDHPQSPRHDFRANDVMGAIVVRVPLEF
jgi:hypothetical protein